MEKIKVKGQNSVSYVIVDESLSNLKHYIPSKGVFIITDKNVGLIYKNQLPNFPLYTVESGEGCKSLQSAINVYRWLLDEGADRSSFIVGVGGGAVCDLTGFIASTFMRGVPFGFVATTLLAQVDASIGGKNGINLDGFKNIIGTFNQPQFVICDISMLKTLPGDEFSNGLAEVVKYSIISEDQKFSFLEENIDKILGYNHDILANLVTQSVKIKADIVKYDEQEKDLRRILNLGHTWGHAVEKITGIPHGQAVSIGIAFAANLSCDGGLLSVNDRDRNIRLLKSLGLPTETFAHPSVIFDAMVKDKKKEGSTINFVLVKRIGKVKIQPIPVIELKNFIIK